MSRYTIKDLISNGIKKSQIDKAIKIIDEINIQKHYSVVFEFHEAPKELRKVCCLNGGDEDWLIVTNFTKELDWPPRWLDYTDSCNDPDIYFFGNSIVYVGNHG